MASGHAATNPQEADKLVDLFLRRGVDINAASRQQRIGRPGDGEGPSLWTALHLAALAGDPDEVRLLLNHGARRDVLDGRRRTPLDLALLRQKNSPGDERIARVIELLQRNDP